MPKLKKKPLLVPLLGVKEWDCLPPCILRFRLRLNRFSYNIKHIPGKELHTADTLSRAPMSYQMTVDRRDSQDLAEMYVSNTTAHLPASNQRLETYRKAQSEDAVCRQILEYCRTGWPHKRNLNPTMRKY